MKTIHLTLIAIASLRIAAMNAKSDEVTLPVLSRDVTIGGVTTHYGAPVFAPDTTSDGKWTPYPARNGPDAKREEDRYATSLADIKNKLLALITPTISLENGLVVGHGVPSLNHNGGVYAGLTIHPSIAGNTSILTDEQVQNNLAALQREYRENIKTGKWRKFVNGE